MDEYVDQWIELLGEKLEEIQWPWHDLGMTAALTSRLGRRTSFKDLVHPGQTTEETCQVLMGSG